MMVTGWTKLSNCAASTMYMKTMLRPKASRKFTLLSASVLARPVHGRAPPACLRPEPDVVLLVGLLVLRDRLAGDVGLNGGGDVLHADTLVRSLLTVDQESQLGGAHGERRVDIDQARELAHADHQ